MSLVTVHVYSPPGLHQQTGVGHTEAHVPGPLGQHTQPRRQGRVDHNHLTVLTKQILGIGKG